MAEVFGADARGSQSGSIVLIPAGVSSEAAFMIAKDPHSIAIKILRQEQSLRDHGDAVEVVYVLNPKFPDLIPPTTWLNRRGTLDIQDL